jgi:hypothetical protein
MNEKNEPINQTGVLDDDVVLVKMRVAAAAAAALTCTSYRTGPHAGTRNSSVTAARAAGGSGGGVKMNDMHDGPRGEASRINVALDPWSCESLGRAKIA